MTNATYWAWDATDKGYYVYDPNPATDAGKINQSTGTYDKSNALLFFPAAGFGSNASLRDAGSGGHCGSSSLISSRPASVYRLYFHNFYVYPTSDVGRNCGQSVRPLSD